MRHQIEAVARCLRRAHTPACRRSAGFERFRRAQDQQRQTGFPRTELQALAGLEVERIEHTGHCRERGRAQRFLNGPKALLVIGCLRENYARRVKPDTTQTVAIRLAITRVPAVRHDEQRAIRVGAIDR